MKFNQHQKLEGLHAPFSASKSSWLRYDDDKTIETYQNIQAKMMGTKLHEWAKATIDLGIRQPRSNKTLYAYVNDAIGFHMDTEVVLFYSDKFFGTADAICYRYEKAYEKNVLRIHDLKTGKRPVHMDQLYVYAALFCLEYKVKPGEIAMELRIYQNDEVEIDNPTAEDILPVMDKIIHLNKLMEKYDKEG